MTLRVIFTGRFLFFVGVFSVKVNENKGRSALKSRNVTICAVVVFLLRENTAQSNRGELSDLGQELADASDYLTDEARKFSVTGDIEHLYNYWYEVYEEKTRDRVINSLSAIDPPENETALLAEAKK